MAFPNRSDQLPRGLAAGAALTLLLYAPTTIVGAWLIGRDSYDQRLLPVDTAATYLAAATVGAILVAELRICVWWLGKIVRGSFAATILLGVYHVYTAVLLVGILIAYRAGESAAWISLTAVLAVAEGVLSVLFLVPSSLRWAQRGHR